MVMTSPTKTASGKTASGERPRTPLLPQHFIGWAAVLWLLASGGLLASWGKFNDVVTNGTAQIGTTVAVGLLAVVLVWQAHFRRKDRSVLLGVLSVLMGMVALFAVLFVLALVGQALS